MSRATVGLVYVYLLTFATCVSASEPLDRVRVELRAALPKLQESNKHNKHEMVLRVGRAFIALDDLEAARAVADYALKFPQQCCGAGESFVREFAAFEARMKKVDRTSTFLQRMTDRPWKGDVVLHMAEASLAGGHAAEAGRLATQALALIRKDRPSDFDLIQEGDDLRRLAIVFFRGKANRELDGVREMLSDLPRRCDRSECRAAAHSELARLYVVLGDLTKAKQLAKEAAENADASDSNWIAHSVIIALCDTGQPEIAERIARRLPDDDIGTQRRAIRTIARHYEGQGELQRAFKIVVDLEAANDKRDYFLAELSRSKHGRAQASLAIARRINDPLIRHAALFEVAAKVMRGGDAQQAQAIVKAIDRTKERAQATDFVTMNQRFLRESHERRLATAEARWHIAATGKINGELLNGLSPEYRASVHASARDIDGAIKAAREAPPDKRTEALLEVVEAVKPAEPKWPFDD